MLRCEPKGFAYRALPPVGHLPGSPHPDSREPPYVWASTKIACVAPTRRHRWSPRADRPIGETRLPVGGGRRSRSTVMRLMRRHAPACRRLGGPRALQRPVGSNSGEPTDGDRHAPGVGAPHHQAVARAYGVDVGEAGRVTIQRLRWPRGAFGPTGPARRGSGPSPTRRPERAWLPDAGLPNLPRHRAAPLPARSPPDQVDRWPGPQESYIDKKHRAIPRAFQCRRRRPYEVYIRLGERSATPTLQ